MRYPEPQQTVQDVGSGFIAAEWPRDGERVQFPDGSHAPREWMFFDSTGPQSGPLFIIECEVGEDLVPRVVTVMACSRDGGREVRASDLRRLRPLDEVITQSFELVAFRPGTEVTSANPRNFIAEATERRRMLRGVRRQDRRRFTDDMAEQVAHVYVDNLESGMPTKAVREHFGIAESTASLYVKRARPLIDNLIEERRHGSR